MRHTFGSLLSKGGVAPRTAQAALRHSHIDLTMNVYTDPRLLDVAGALDALPSLPLDGPAAETAQATGTEGAILGQLSSPLAPNLVQARQSLAAGDNETKRGTNRRGSPPLSQVGPVSKVNATLTSPANMESRAGEGIRTPDVQLGKLAFYH